MQRHTMRKIREVLRLRLELGRSHREIQASTGLSKGSVSDYLIRAARAGVTWEVARELIDAEVEARLFTRVGAAEPPTRTAIDFDWVHRETVTLRQPTPPRVRRALAHFSVPPRLWRRPRRTLPSVVGRGPGNPAEPDQGLESGPGEWTPVAAQRGRSRAARSLAQNSSPCSTASSRATWM